MKSHILKLKIGVYNNLKIGSRLIIGKIHSTIFFPNYRLISLFIQLHEIHNSE